MAAKIGLVLALDGEKEFSAGLRAANAAVKEAKSGFEAVKELYDGQANSSTALEARQRELVKIQQMLNEKQKAAADGLDNSNLQLDKINKKLAEYSNESADLTSKLSELEAQGKKNTKEYAETEKALEKVQEAEKAEQIEKNKQLTSYAKWQTALNQANREITKNDRELEKNAMYLEEAANSSDKCAISMDKFGNEVRDIGKAKADAAVNVLKKEFDDYKETLVENTSKARELSNEMVQLNAKQTEATNAVKQTGIAYDGEANTMAALVAKHNALLDVNDALADKQKNLTESLKNSDETLGKIETQMGTYKSRIAETKEAMEKCNRETKEGREEYQRLEAKLGELKSEEAEVTSEHSRFIASNAKLQTELSKVNLDIEENNRELDKNGQYLREAQGSADHCATSIDKFGKETKQAEEASKSFGEILEDKLFKQFTKEKLIDLAISAVQRLGQACVNAAKQVVTLGMEYDAQMARVKSVSQASDREMKLLDETARRLGRDTVFTAKEAGEGMQNLAMSGWKARDIIAGIPAILDLSSASGLDLAQTATYISDTLNAFNKDASEASRLTDIFAYAMSNSSMTAEDLGEAYGKVASTAAAFGYSEESVTAVLMNMANQGKKAGEAGTAINTILTRLATNTSECSDAIKEYNGGIDIMYDQTTGQMRPLEDVLHDLKDVWDDLTPAEQNALGKLVAGTRQGNALRIVMSGLSEDIEGTGESFDTYLEGLQNCEGVVQSMAETNLDNLNGDVTILNSALSGLGIELERKLDGGLRSVVKGVTSVINDLTEAISEPKNELSDFISDVEKSNDRVSEAISKSQSIVSGASSAKEDFEVYGSILMDLTNRTDLTTDEQYKLKIAVDNLAASVPGLAEAFDQQTWSLNLTNEELSEMLKNSEQLAVANVLLEARSQMTKDMVEADIAEKKAIIAKTQAEEEYNKAIEANGGIQAFITPEDWAAIQVYTDNLDRATLAEEEASNNKQTLKEDADLLDQSLAGVASQYNLVLDEMGNYVIAAEESAAATEDAKKRIDAARQFDEYGNDITFMDEEDAKEITKATEEIIKAYEDMNASVVSSIESCIDMMKEWSGGEEISADQIILNLESQKAGLEQWRDDMVEIASHVGTDMSQELYESLIDLGPQSANLIHTIAEAARQQGEADSGDFTDIVKTWEDAMSIRNSASMITAYTTQGQAIAEAQADGLQLGLPLIQDIMDKIHEAVATNAEDIEESAEVIDQSVESLGQVEEAVRRVYDQYGNDITNITDEDEIKRITKATEDIIAAYDSMEESVVNSITSCINMMSEWSGGEEIDTNTIIQNLEGQKKGLETWRDDMVEISKHVGDGMSEEMYTSLVELGPASANMIHTIAEAARRQGEEDAGEFTDITNAWEEAMKLQEDADLIAAYTTQGQDIARAYADGLELERPQVENAMQEIQNSIATASGDAADEAASGGEDVGGNLADSTQSSITAKESEVADAAAKMIQQAKASAYSETAGASSIGWNIAAGVASGLYSGTGDVAEAGRYMIRTTMASMKAESEIRSPSRKFKREVGAQIAAGVAFGIKDNASMAGKEAANMSKKVLKSATSWLSGYKKSHKVTLEEEKYYWTQVSKHVKKGSDAYIQAINKISDANKKLSASKNGNILTEAGFTTAKAAEIAKKINNAFDVSWYTGTGKKKKKKDAEKYYKDVLSAATNYANDQKKINDWTLEQEYAFWKKFEGKVKTGTDAYFDVRGKLHTLEKNIASQTLKNKSTLLDYYKTYNKVGLKGEMEYWDKIRQLFKTGTVERIEADQKYLESKENYYSALEDLDNEYVEEQERINEELKGKLEDLNSAYADAVSTREKDILGQMNLFESFDSEGYSSERLISNLESQVAALALWEEKLQELKDRGISDELYEMLSGAGVDNAANVYSIAQMTDEQLAQYEELFRKRTELAHSQAVKENHQLLEDTNNMITDAMNEAQTSLDELNASYQDKLSEITGGLGNVLSKLITKSGSLGEDAIAAFFKGMKVDTDASYEIGETVQKLTAGLGTMIDESTVIGQNALAGILKGLSDEEVISAGADKTISLIKKALQDAADIHSPSRLFRDEIGMNIGLGIQEGIEGTEDSLATSAENVIANMITSAQREFQKKQYAITSMANGLSSGGVHMLNELMGTYTPNTVVNVDNSGIVNQMAVMFSQLSGVMQSLMNMQVVMDSGELVGAIAPGINSEMGNTYAIDHRGKLRG